MFTKQNLINILFIIVIISSSNCSGNKTRNEAKGESINIDNLENEPKDSNIILEKIKSNDDKLNEELSQSLEKTNNHIDTFKMKTKNFNNKTLLKTDSLENEIIFIELKKYCLECDTIAINKHLPYGSKKLINHKFPAEGFVFYKNVDSMSNQNQNSFIKILGVMDILVGKKLYNTLFS